MHEFDLDAEAVRRLGYRAADLAAEHRAGLLDRPVFGKVGGAAASFDEPLPEKGLPIDAVLADVRERILPRAFGNSHPRFFAFINATADPVGVVADYLAANMNSNCWGGDHAAIHVERQVLRWLAAILGLPAESEGILTSGGSMANFTALATARRAKAPGVREDGFAGTEPLVVYASEEAHNCVDKAVDLLGIGWKQLRKLPTDDGYRLRVDVLKQAIAEDRRAGRRPAIVVGSAGTVNTGAVDPLAAIADVCAAEGLWFHVDGAYGAMAAISRAQKPLFDGLERADSVAADPHKWLYMPVECGCVMVRDGALLREAFSLVPAYLRTEEGKGFGGLPWFSEYEVQQTRGFRALKLWMVLQHFGRRGVTALVNRHADLARRLAERIDAAPDLERLAPVGLSIVCFRYVPRGLRGDEARLDALNKRVMEQVQADGAAFITNATVAGRFALRACVLHYATGEDDLDALVDAVRRAGAAREKA